MGNRFKKATSVILCFVLLFGYSATGGEGLAGALDSLFDALSVKASAETDIYSDWSSWSTTPVSSNSSREVQTKKVNEWWRTLYNYDYYCTWKDGSSAATAYEYSNVSGNYHYYGSTGFYITAYSYTKNVQAYPNGYYRDVAPGYVLSKSKGELPGNTAYMDYCKNAGNKTGYAGRADVTGQEQGRNQIFFLVGSKDEYHDVTYYRYRTITKAYSVGYNANGGSGAPSAQTKTHGTNLTLSSVKPSRTGYTFKNWNTKADGSGTSYASGAVYSSNADVTLYAQWTVTTYTVSYNANGGSGAPSAQTKTYGKDLTLSTVKSTRTGYTFKNWNTKADGSGTSYASGATYKENAAVTLYAQWSINSYTITFRYGEVKNNAVYKIITQDYDTAVTMPDAPSVSDNSFKGWDVSVPSKMPAKNMTVKALWSVVTYTVLFNANAGSNPPESQDKIYRQDLTLTDEKPTRAGYTFRNWNTKADGSGTSYDPGAIYSENSAVTLYAQWDINNYTAWFAANGGSFESGTTESKSVTYGSAITADDIPVPVKDGFDFLGWSRNYDAVSAESLGTMDSVYGVAFFAVWSKKKYSIEYNANGGSGAPDAQTKTYNSDVILASDVPTREDYIFVGWGTSSTATSAKYQPGDTYSENRSQVLYAVWAATDYTIEYDANGGTGAPGSQIKDYKEDLILSSQIPVREGYTFLGWAPKSAFASGKKPWLGDYTPTLSKIYINDYQAALSTVYASAEYQPGEIYEKDEDVILYAVWEGTKFVDYDANGGKYPPSTQTFIEGKSIALSNAKPIREHFIFEGWATSADAEEPILNPGDNYSGETIVLYAVWTEIEDGSHVISYNSNGGKGGPDYQIKKDNQPITITNEIPKNLGYRFICWSTLKPISGSILSGKKYYPGDSYTANESVTLYANWEKSPISHYEVITYTMDIDGHYYVSSHNGEAATVGDIITAEYTIQEGFSLNSELSQLSGTVDEDGLVLEVYIDRNKHTVTYNDGSKEIFKGLYYYGAPVTEPQTPEKEGYSFRWWSEDGETVVEVEKTVPDRDIEYIAVWKPNKYKLQYYIDGKLHALKIIDCNATVTRLLIPKKQGYTFSGWDNEEPERMPASNVVLSGSFIPDSDTKYTLETYLMNLSGEYDKTVKVFTGITDETATAEYTVPEGFSLNAAKSEIEGVIVADSSLVLKVYLDRNIHTVSFDNGTGKTAKDLCYGDDITKPANPEKDGFNFEGWSEDGETVVAVDETVPDRDIDYIAVWSVNSYKIAFKYGEVNNNVVYQTITEDFGASIEKVADPKFEGYTFLGWDSQIPATMPAENLTITALWAVNEYAVTFRYGNVNHNAAYKTITQDFGTAIEEIADPKIAGYTFLGWDSQIPETMPAESMTITALWSINEYKITYKLDGAEYFTAPDESAVDTFAYGSEVTVRPNAFKEGYTVLDWSYTKEDGEPVKIKIGDRMPAYNIIASAHAEKISYEIIFDTNGGTLAEKSARKNYGEDLDLSVIIPEKKGFSFLGWEENNQPVGGKYTKNASTTLRAKWEKHFDFSKDRWNTPYYHYAGQEKLTSNIYAPIELTFYEKLYGEKNAKILCKAFDKTGHCFGLALSTGLLNSNRDLLEKFNENNLIDVEVNSTHDSKGKVFSGCDEEISSTDFVKFCHIYQSSAEYYKSRTEIETSKDKKGRVKDTVKDLYEAAYNYQYDNGSPLIIGFIPRGMSDGGHEVYMTCLISGSYDTGSFDIGINDSEDVANPNLVIRFTKDNKGAWDWEYGELKENKVIDKYKGNSAIKDKSDIWVMNFHPISNDYSLINEAYCYSRSKLNRNGEKSHALSHGYNLVRVMVGVVEMVLSGELWKIDNCGGNSSESPELYWAENCSELKLKNTGNEKTDFSVTGDNYSVKSALEPAASATVTVDDENSKSKIEYKDSEDVKVSYSYYDNEGKEKEIVISGKSDSGDLSFINKENNTLLSGCSKCVVEVKEDDKTVSKAECNITEATKEKSFAITVDDNNKIEIETNNCSINIIGFKNTSEIKYRTSVTYHCNYTALPNGASIHWFLNNDDCGPGETLTVTNAKESYSIQVKILGKDGGILAESKTETVKVRNGFFDKIIWFFEHLFNPGKYIIDRKE